MNHWVVGGSDIGSVLLSVIAGAGTALAVAVAVTVLAVVFGRVVGVIYI
jgi:ABC-type dipeptide/oligopeptide/nickel transport system permease subunit